MPRREHAVAIRRPFGIYLRSRKLNGDGKPVTDRHAEERQQHGLYERCRNAGSGPIQIGKTAGQSRSHLGIDIAIGPHSSVSSLHLIHEVPLKTIPG